jgi:hypothetical protein
MSNEKLRRYIAQKPLVSVEQTSSTELKQCREVYLATDVDPILADQNVLIDNQEQDLKADGKELAERDRTIARLREYVEHKRDCRKTWASQRGGPNYARRQMCTCGLERLLADIQEAGNEG